MTRETVPDRQCSITKMTSDQLASPCVQRGDKDCTTRGSIGRKVNDVGCTLAAVFVPYI